MPKGGTVAYCGAGIMARGMIQNLLKDGWSVRCFNRTPDKLSDLIELGASSWPSPAAAAEGASCVIASVSDDTASEAIWFGPSGVASGSRPGLVAIETSTLSVSFTQTWAMRLHDDGVRALACPVTGSRNGAQSGTLFGFVGGDPVALSAVQPILSSFCSRLRWFGTASQAMQFKLLYNAIGAGIGAVFAEGLSLAARTDLNMEDVLSVLMEVGWGASVAKSKGPSMASRFHDDLSFSVELMQKDLSYALELSRDVEQPTPFAKLSHDVYSTALNGGFGGKDISAIVECFLRRELK